MPSSPSSSKRGSLGLTSVGGFFLGFGGGRGGIFPLLPKVPDWFSDTLVSFFLESSLDGEVLTGDVASSFSTLGFLLKDPVSGFPFLLRVLLSETCDWLSEPVLNSAFLGSGWGVEVFLAVQLILFMGSWGPGVDSCDEILFLGLVMYCGGTGDGAGSCSSMGA